MKTIVPKLIISPTTEGDSIQFSFLMVLLQIQILTATRKSSWSKSSYKERLLLASTTCSWTCGEPKALTSTTVLKKCGKKGQKQHLKNLYTPFKATLSKDYHSLSTI